VGLSNVLDGPWWILGTGDAWRLGYLATDCLATADQSQRVPKDSACAADLRSCADVVAKEDKTSPGNGNAA
jgi:hypothetical protein